MIFEKESDYVDLNFKVDRYSEVLKAMLPVWRLSDEPWGIKDNSSRFVYANESYHKLLNLPLDFKIEGLLHDNFPSPTSAYAEQFRLHDQLVERTLNRVTSLETHPFGSDQKIASFLFDKFPLINCAGEFIGIIFHGRKFEILNVGVFYDDDFPSSVTFYPPSTLFTEREWDIVFFKMQNDSNKKISLKLGISRRTVEKIISIIYEKCQVTTHDAFKEFIVENKFDAYIPQKFLTIKRSIII